MASSSLTVPFLLVAIIVALSAQGYTQTSPTLSLKPNSTPQRRVFDKISELETEIRHQCRIDRQTSHEWIRQQIKLYQDLKAQWTSLRAKLKSDVESVKDLKQQSIQIKKQISDLRSDLEKIQKAMQTINNKLTALATAYKADLQANDDESGVWTSALNALNTFSTAVITTKLTQSIDSDYAVFVTAMAKVKGDLTSTGKTALSDLAKDVKKYSGQSATDRAATQTKILADLKTVKTAIMSGMNDVQTARADIKTKYANSKGGLDDSLSKQGEKAQQTQTSIDQNQKALEQVAESLDATRKDIVAIKANKAEIKAQAKKIQFDVKLKRKAIRDAKLQCKSDLDEVERCREYIAERIGNMSPASVCHPGSKGCLRCLYNAHCSKGQHCTDLGFCKANRPKLF